MPGSSFPDPIVEPFGSSAGAGYITYPIPVPSQLPTNPGYASFADGFPPATMTPSGSGGVPPRGQDMNGILYMLSAYAALQTGGQFWQYNSTYEGAVGGYVVGAILQMASGNGFWLNTVNGNTNNPDTVSAAISGWVPLAAYGTAALSGLTNANVTLSPAQAGCPMITFAGTLTANIQIIFPAWLKEWTVANLTSGNFTVTCKTSSGTGVVIPQNGSAAPCKIYGDGTNILPLSMSGSWTATLSGPWASNQSGTINWKRQGNQVTVYSEVNISATAANSLNGITISGLPNEAAPSANRIVPCSELCMASAHLLGCAKVLSGGNQIFLTPYHQIVLGGDDFMQSGASFQSGSSAGIFAGWSVSYCV